MSPGGSEDAGASDNRQLARRLSHRIPSGNGHRAPAELSRRYVEVHVDGHGLDFEPRGGGGALHPGDLRGGDVWIRRGEVVEDVDQAEAGGGGVGDGGVGHAV